MDPDASAEESDGKRPADLRSVESQRVKEEQVALAPARGNLRLLQVLQALRREVKGMFLLVSLHETTTGRVVLFDVEVRPQRTILSTPRAVSTRFVGCGAAAEQAHVLPVVQVCPMTAP